MIRSWRLFLAARSARTALVLAAVVVLVSLLERGTVIEIRFVVTEPSRSTMLWEALPAIYGTLVGALIAPRMHSWERTATAPLRWYYAATTTVALATPLLGPWLVHVTLPAQTSGTGILFNVLMITAIGLLATCLLGTIIGPLIALSTYLTVILAQHAARDLTAWLPFSHSLAEPTPHTWETLAAATLAIAAWTITRGQSALARAVQRDSVGA
ncbi:hypothetical protein EF847_02855 [Actinobacteria bacterium YIM 96077]|uniref:Uncharacterized protein n=1 Tax=Phytoactinopolyspora halophila TaxID=1981511 RepID=A0A329QBQ3_9ACTN|nr:hypothetical protein [Phytoactinopolyspora halophila]AYY11814.1 hypothetical protein EF847_02855 [Actinobacteria bacterium YIM 96077]RAW09835.1 hypothetical protein DPM12_20030 [Phytoactinopolyspora halophila]